MAGSNGSAEELNLVPYLDVVTTLILALVITLTYADIGLHQAKVDVALPEAGVAGASPRAHTRLTVDVQADGVDLRAEGGSSAHIAGDDGLPLEALQGVMRRLHDSPAPPDEVVLTAGPSVPYRTVVATLDALRSDSHGPLYPRVALQGAE